MPAKPDIIHGRLMPASGPDYDRGKSGIREWSPRERHAGSQGLQEFRGSNVYLGSPDVILDALSESLLAQEESLRFAAECCTKVRQYDREYIIAYSHALASVPDDIGRGAAPKKLEAERLTSDHKARLSDAKYAWSLARLACDTQKSQLSAVQTAAGMLKKQMEMDGVHG